MFNPKFNFLMNDEASDVADFNSQLGESEPEYEGATPKQPSKSNVKTLSSSDYCSWGVLGNEQFVPSGKTITSIPSGTYRFAMNAQGQVVLMKTKVCTDNLFELADTVSLKVLESIGKFWHSKDKYNQFGMLFKRGVLLYGPPGGGKTVALTLLANQVQALGGIVTMCENPDLASTGIQTIRRIEPDRPIVNIMEDIDSIIDGWGDSAILSLLDGENQVPNIVNLATTNYPERLDPRLVNRPSRFDEIRKVDMPKPEVRRAYFAHVLPEFMDKDKKPLVEGVNGELDTWVRDTDKMSMAHLRELIIATRCLERDYDSTIKRLKTMQNTKPKVKGGKGSGFVESPDAYDSENYE
jgi:hypothetical protein